MVVRRRYEDGCGVAHALDMIGERWSLLIVRDLLLGPKRFTDLQAGLPGAGPNILAQRLRDLQETGVVRRHTLPPPAGSRVYELTEWGAQLGPVIALLGRWGATSPVIPRQGEFGADSIMVALRSSFTARPDDPWTAAYEIRLGRDRFALRVVDGALVEASRGEHHERPDAVVETDPGTLGELMSGALTVAGAADARRLTLTGDAAAAQRLLDAARM
jgi:DNA-binding HxlR family transcriptional regulator